MHKQSLMQIVGVWLVIFVFSWVLVNEAQDRQLESDTLITVTIGEDPAWLEYEGLAGEIITISTLTAITDTAPDTTLEILSPTGKRLAYADDVILPDNNLKSDAVLENIELPVDGIYQIRVDSFNGVSVGEVEVILTHPLVDYDVLTLDEQTVFQGEITPNTPLEYEFEISVDTSLTLTARDISGTLDPILFIYDANGNLLAFNDDHRTQDLTLDVFDARFTDFNISEPSVIRVVMRDYLGRSGEVELIISS